MTKEQKTRLMEIACDLCRFPYECANEEALAKECENCPLSAELNEMETEQTDLEAAYIRGVKDRTEEARKSKEMNWLFSSIENPRFQICPFCCEAYRTDLPVKLKYCPACGRKPKDPREGET